MHQSIHQQLIRGIQGLNPAQARQLQDLLAALKDGAVASTDGAVPGASAAVTAVTAAPAAAAADATPTADAAAASGADPSDPETDGDLPQPDCAQDDLPAAPTSVWGPPPLSAINFEQMQLIACLIREANEARNARRQRFGL